MSFDVDYDNVSLIDDAVNVTALDCPSWDGNGEAFVDWCVFWLEGVVLSTIAVLGIMGNVLSTVRAIEDDGCIF